MIKCVIWDIDNTLLAGTFLESAEPPPPDEQLVCVLRELSGRGILQALASKNPPAACEHVRAVTQVRFAAAECGWDRKSAAIGRILAGLGLQAAESAFVDDDLFERAEVAAAMPDILVLTPEDAAEAVQWPQFSPAVLTAEGKRRAELYEQRQLRDQEARAHAGSRDDFLRYADTKVQIGTAGPADVARLHELSVRTHQLNSSGQPAAEAEFARLLGSVAHLVVTVRLADRFGDDGMVGGAVVERGPADWQVGLLMMSCRALGRGVVDALLAWLCRAAAQAGAAAVLVPCLVSERNLPLRLALAAAGFRAPDERGREPASRAVFARQVSGPAAELPALADWVSAPELP
jgi:methoxymalonate biosynthesis protein